MQAEGLEQPQTVIDATNQYREDSDIIGQFIKECLIEFSSTKTPLKDVHAAYENWCKDYGYGSLNNRNLIAELRKKGHTIQVGTGNRTFLFGYGIACDKELPKEWRQAKI